MSRPSPGSLRSPAPPASGRGIRPATSPPFPPPPIHTEIEWRRLRADQLRERAGQDAIVILPVASLEQHGPHLPVEVDSLLGETVAQRAAHKMAARGQQALVLPVLWTGLSEHHMSFGGTVTLGLSAFYAVIEDVCRSLVRHGF